MILTIKESRKQKLMIDHEVIFNGKTVMVSENIEKSIKNELKNYGYEISEWSE